MSNIWTITWGIAISPKSGMLGSNLTGNHNKTEKEI
jgi:hypothetical protein